MRCDSILWYIHLAHPTRSTLLLLILGSSSVVYPVFPVMVVSSHHHENATQPPSHLFAGPNGRSVGIAEFEEQLRASAPSIGEVEIEV